MSKILLIDTCVWKSLVSKVEFSKYLKQLITWADHDYITIYCPVPLQDEWTKHREIELNSLARALKQHVASIKKLELLDVPIDLGEAQLSQAEELLKSQILAIDRLLQEGVQIPEGGPELLLTRKHKKNRKAPYINKLDSDNDALLIFSSLEELDRTGESELIFFSENHTEFGDPDDKMHSIHADIAQIKPQIIIRYFANYQEGIDFLIRAGLPSNKVADSKLNNVKKLIIVDRSKPVVDQMHEYLEKRFADIRILPQHLFGRHYPFITSERFAFHSQPFTIQTDNQELFDLFKDLPKKNEVFDPVEDELNADITAKLFNILKWLRGNFIHHISIKQNQNIEIPQFDDGLSCSCPNCQYRNFNFSGLLKGIGKIADDQPTLKKAYAFYIVGKFRLAVQVLRDVAEIALKEKNLITYFISQYNLTKLGWFIDHNSYQQDEDKDLINELKKTDLDAAFVISKTPATKDILSYIQNAKFVNAEIIGQLVAKIREDFYNESSGFNNQTREILYEYFVSDSFLQYNYIMYDEFSQYAEFNKLFIEGLFASFGCRDTLGGKLIHFTEPIVEEIVRHGNAKHIRAMFHRYKLKTLKYEETDGGWTFRALVATVLNDYEKVVEYYRDFNPDGKANMVFWSRYKRCIQNAFTMASILDLTTDSIQLITDDILICQSWSIILFKIRKIRFVMTK
jgi:hypothetical protein